jgi:hypothetical protein
MSKIQLVLSDKCYTSFDQPWIVDIVKNYFDIVYIEHNPYLNKEAIFVTNALSDEFCEQDKKIIIDNLWEIYKPDNRGLVLENKNWFWYNESLWYRYLNYHNHVPNINIYKNALLLMNRKKLHRDSIFRQLDLSKLLYSYVGVGIKIDGDADINNGEWQRYFNPDWYNSTAFSVIAETTVSQQDPLFVTEKTFKPIAFQHPFIVFGQAGILKYIRSLGFETFENMFDELYDDLNDADARLANITKQINNFSYSSYDNLTIEKLKYNKELFFNETLVKSKIIKEIIEPILEYAEA